MTYRPTKLKFLLIAFGLSVHCLSFGIGDTCVKDCILQTASNDQDCDLEKTPLVRCEKLDEFRRINGQLDQQ